MYKNGHRGAALVLMAPLTATFGIVGLGMSALAVAVCRLPDLDHDYSWLAHRGPTHTIWFVSAVAGLVSVGSYAGLSMLPVTLPALPLALLLGATVFLGLLSHLFADALTVGRDTHAIRPFHPLFPHPFRLGLVRADSRLANSLLLAGGVLFQGLAFAISIGGITGAVA
jgi:inner membrane protein